MLQLQGDQRKVRTCRSADCLQQRCCGWLFCCSARAVASCLSLFAVASCLPACGCSAGRGHVAVAQPSCIRDAETDVAPAPPLAPHLAQNVSAFLLDNQLCKKDQVKVHGF